MGAADIDIARAALWAIPADLPRDGWVKAGMAAHAAGLTFDDFDQWSAQAESYDARAVRDTWRSFKPGKGIGPGTLFDMAAKHGHTQARAEPRTPLARQAAQKAPGATAAAVWGRCEPATNTHPYIAQKKAAGVPLESLRVVPAGDPLRIAGESMAGALVVPVQRPDGTLASLQFITPPDTADRLKAKGKPAKLNLPGASLDGWHVVGELVPGGVAFVVEGIGQAWACWQATGDAAVVAFGWGRVRQVAQALAQQDPAARLVLVPDAGKESQAAKIAAELGAEFVAMPEGWPQNSDVSDLAQREGMDALVELLAEAKKPAPVSKLNVVAFDDLAHTEPEGPRYVWHGLVPAGFVTLLGAHGGTGKSTVALMLGVCVALGRPLFGIHTEPGNVAFFSGEDGAQLLRHRLHTVCKCMGVDIRELKDRLHIIDATDDPVLFAEVTTAGRREGVTTATFTDLSKLVREHDIRLLVIDNASDTFDASEIDRARVRGFMRALSSLARENDAGVLLLAHVDKGTSRGDRLQNTEAYSGSTAWHNSARSRLFMSRDKDGALTLEHQKNNLGPRRDPIGLVWPAGGIPQTDEALSPMVQGIADRNHEKALIRLIAEYTERGEFITTATTSRTHAAKLLRHEPTFPHRMKDGEVFDLLRRAERAGYLERVQFKGADRKDRERWQVTASGASFAGLPAATAATAATTQVTAPSAHAAKPTAATAATSPLGGTGEKARTQVTAHLEAEA